MTGSTHAEKPHEATTPALRGQSLATLCKAASEPLRLHILRVLSQDSFGVQELADIFSIPQPGMSHHLKVLAKSGLVVTRRQGNSIFYRRAVLKNDDELSAFQTHLYSAIDSIRITDAADQRRNLVYQDRASRSQDYFEQNAGKFAEHQGLLCEVGQYFPGLQELLDLMKLAKSSRVMEVGPGQGLLLEELARRYDQLVALDQSPGMLSLAKGSIHKWTGNQIEFVNSSFENYEPAGTRFDAVVMNMVMHHMPSPAKTFLKLKQILQPQGHVLVADLCTHNQEWVKDSCGDVWLGFDPQDLHDWAESAGFTEAQSLYLGLKNGFQIQLKLFSSSNT